MARLVAAAARLWALLGGLVLLGILGVTAASVTLDILYNAPIPGDFELVQLGCAVAVFAFLPWSQIRRGHVAIDIFTQRAGLRFRQTTQAAGSLLMLLFALLLLWRMTLGLMSYYDPVFPETTPILGVPVWLAFPPILASCALWALASLVTLLDDIRSGAEPR